MGIKIKQIDGLQDALDNAGGGGGGAQFPTHNTYRWVVGGSANINEMEAAQSSNRHTLSLNKKSLDIDMSGGVADPLDTFREIVRSSGWIDVYNETQGSLGTYQAIQLNRTSLEITVCNILVSDLHQDILSDIVSGDILRFNFHTAPGLPIRVDSGYVDTYGTYDDWEFGEAGWLDGRVYTFSNDVMRPDTILYSDGTIGVLKSDIYEEEIELTGLASQGSYNGNYPGASSRAVFIMKNDLEAGAQLTYWFHQANINNRARPQVYINGIKIKESAVTWFVHESTSEPLLIVDPNYEVDSADEIVLRYKASRHYGA